MRETLQKVREREEEYISCPLCFCLTCFFSLRLSVLIRLKKDNSYPVSLMMLSLSFKKA